MYYSDEITLRTVLYTTDSMGGRVATYVDTVVFADKKSATRSEFYTANMSGIKISTVFVVRAEDYDGETIVLYNGTNYDIVRSFQKGGNAVELMCAVREVA